MVMVLKGLSRTFMYQQLKSNTFISLIHTPIKNQSTIYKTYYFPNTCNYIIGPKTCEYITNKE